jgi:hypothetical protein
MLSDGLLTAVKGVITLAMIRDNWPDLTRHIRDTPRKRKRKTPNDLTTLMGADRGLS